MTRFMKVVSTLTAGIVIAWPLPAQTPAKDPSERLSEVLPAHIRDHVLATIAAARARELPAAALEQRALKFAAKGVSPDAIARSVSAHVDRMERARAALQAARARRATGDEIEAGAEVLSKGVDGAAVSELARSAPSGRSLAVPLFVIGSLMDRGLPSDEALQRVHDRLQERATDAELERLPAEAQGRRAAARSRRPATAGRPATGPGARPTGVGGGRPTSVPPGPPPGVPANPGAGARPTPPASPPPGRP